MTPRGVGLELSVGFGLELGGGGAETVLEHSGARLVALRLAVVAGVVAGPHVERMPGHFCRLHRVDAASGGERRDRALSTFDDVMGTPAWKSLPSWFLVAENDEVIPPDAERQFAQRMGADTIEVVSGHCAMVSHPEETHERIVTAANAVAVQRG